MEIQRVNNLDFDMLMKVLNSTQMSEVQKTQFVQKNKPAIENIMKIKISNTDFETLMQKRKLQKFRPLKNSFTKRGDKIILAKALNIAPNEVPNYIKASLGDIKDVNKIKHLSSDKLEMIKTYVYRHGTKDELVAFLDYELTQTKDILKTLHHTLEYYSGGVADYFIRPIHRMDNKTLVKIYNVINKNIKISTREGKISDSDSKKIAKWALVKIYQIQNNSKLINAIKTYKTLA